MADRQFSRISVTLFGAAAALAYVLLLRAVIELLHPKFVAITSLAYKLGFGDWWLAHIGIRDYCFLTSIGWDTALLVAPVIGLAAGAMLAHRASHARSSGA